jgi:hypothetical protein
MRPPVYRSPGDEYFPSLVDVNSDGKEELMVKSYCSALNNCWFDIYRRVGTGFDRIFFTYNSGQKVDLLESTHKGFRDIEITTKKDESN